MIKGLFCRVVNYSTQVNQNVSSDRFMFQGWIKSIRPASKSWVFMTVSDCKQDVQLVIEKNTFNGDFTSIDSLSEESVVRVEGILKERPQKHQTEKQAQEVHVRNLEILNRASKLPLVMNENLLPDEELRMKYRYLDLRRPTLNKNIRLRSKVIQDMRNHLHALEFVEIETPLLFKSTPEGAKEYMVDAGKEGKMYALPQSPQQFKQLLVIGGFEKYFQVAKCFRNEDLRADRQPEFTQLDIEMGFAGQDGVIKLIEGLLTDVWIRNGLSKPVFRTLTYKEAMRCCGSDKPAYLDRFLIKSLPGTNHGHVTEELYLPKELVDDSLIKLFKEDLQEGTLDRSLIEDTNNYSFKVTRDENCNVGKTLLGKARLAAISKLNLPVNLHEFLWVVDFPLFTGSIEQLVSMHHPFTAPNGAITENPLHAKALHYDLVLNGTEIGGGSVRIHDAHLQEKIFRDYLRLPEEKIQLFDHLLQALRHGAPPHAGIALGLDRLLALMCGTSSIRDVIAFPKNGSGYDPLFKTPS